MLRIIFWATLCGLSFGQAFGQELKVATYNVGLAHGYVAYSDERAKLLGPELAQIDSDVLCLQEVWQPEDQSRLTNDLKATFPYVLSIPAQPRLASRNGICRMSDLLGGNRFLSCLGKFCLRKTGQEQTSCLIENCSSSLDALKVSNEQCAAALFAQVGQGTLSALWSVISPFSMAQTLAYGGSAGVMLFSKRPLTLVNILDFADSSTINRRALLHAQTTDAKGASVQVMCTHLTANLEGEIPYPGKYSSWSEETQVQARAISDYAVHVDGPLVFMGDFNCSFPEKRNPKNLRLTNPEGCQILNHGEWTSMSQDRFSDCTFCAENPLVNKNTESTILDHVLYKGSKGSGSVTEVSRIMEQGFAVAPDKVTPLSDHYGLHAVIGTH